MVFSPLLRVLVLHMQNAAQCPLAVGLGCRRGCSVEALSSLLLKALACAGKTLGDVAALASIDAKANEPGLLELAERLGCPLFFFGASELAGQAPYLTHRSAQSFAATGCHGVAESAARLLAERLFSQPIEWVLTRQHSPTATVAIASGVATHG